MFTEVQPTQKCDYQSSSCSRMYWQVLPIRHQTLPLSSLPIGKEWWMYTAYSRLMLIFFGQWQVAGGYSLVAFSWLFIPSTPGKSWPPPCLDRFWPRFSFYFCPLSLSMTSETRYILVCQVRCVCYWSLTHAAPITLSDDSVKIKCLVYIEQIVCCTDAIHYSLSHIEYTHKRVYVNTHTHSCIYKHTHPWTNSCTHVAYAYIIPRSPFNTYTRLYTNTHLLHAHSGEHGGNGKTRLFLKHGE